MKNPKGLYRAIELLIAVLALNACVSGPPAVQFNERRAVALQMFQERCKNAGEKIRKTAENVEGIYLLKIRTTSNYYDQFRLDDPYGHDSTNDEYLLNFLRGFHHQRSSVASPGVPARAIDAPPRVGYQYLDADDPKDGKRYRYTGYRKVVSRKIATAPAVRRELELDPNYDLNNYDFVLDRTPASGPAPRYGVTFDDISTREEREYWIAGSSLKVVDLQTNEVIAERVGYMVDLGQGDKSGGRSPWLYAAENACPGFRRNPHRPTNQPAFAAQAAQTLDFVEKVLHPSK